MGQSTSVRDKSILFTIVRESQGKPSITWERHGQNLNGQGQFLKKWNYLLNFGLVFQKLVYLYS